MQKQGKEEEQGTMFGHGELATGEASNYDSVAEVVYLALQPFGL